MARLSPRWSEVGSPDTRQEGRAVVPVIRLVATTEAEFLARAADLMDQLLEEAARTGIDPSLLLEIMEAETTLTGTAGSPTATAPAG